MHKFAKVRGALSHAKKLAGIINGEIDINTLVTPLEVGKESQ